MTVRASELARAELMAKIPINVDLKDLVTIPVPFTDIEATAIELIAKRCNERASDYVRGVVLAVLPQNLEDLGHDIDKNLDKQIERDIAAGVIDRSVPVVLAEELYDTAKEY